MALLLEPAAGHTEFLRLDHVFVEYGQVQALRDVSISLLSSKIHAVVGEHGAGKTSIGMVMSGTVRPKSGAVYIAGRRFENLSPRISHHLGIETVYQQVQLNDYFSVAENLFFLDGFGSRFGLFNRKRIIAATTKLMDRYGFGLDAETPVGRLNLSDRVLVSILRTLNRNPKLLILDEALERLTARDLQKVLQILRELKERGTAILFITHRIDDVYNFADQVSIVKDGEVLVTDDVDHIDKMNLLKLTYTQLYPLEDFRSLRREFYQFLKYNEAVLLDLPVNLLVVDDRNRVKIINEYCKRYLQLGSDEYVNENLRTLFKDKDDPTLATIENALASPEGTTFFGLPLLINGVRRVNNLRTLPVFDNDTFIGSIIIIEDITEYDQLQKQVMLSEKLASVGMLAAGVAHEINNPLEIVYNYINYIKKSYDQKRINEALDELHQEISYIAGIIRSLLSLAAPSQDERENVDLNTLIGEILRLLRHIVDSKNIQVSFRHTEEDLTVFVNASELKQVILNLIKNSSEAMPEGGEIRIFTDVVVDDKDQRWAVLAFSDTGPGIQSSNPDDIFLPFFSTRKGTGNNTGLGLSICYRIIEQHHGTISVRNLSPRGCLFDIRLPVEQ